MTKLFKFKTETDQANSLAAFLPGGKIFCGRFDSASNLRKFLEGLAGELKRVYNGMNNLSEDYDINLSQELLSNWESAVGIPDSCFPGTGTLSERRTHVIMKLAKMSVQTAEDFRLLGVALGFTDIQVTSLREVSFPPYSVPFTPSSPSNSRFVIVVTGSGVVASVPPYDVPFTPAANSATILQCVFELVKPANVKINYVNS